MDAALGGLRKVPRPPGRCRARRPPRLVRDLRATRRGMRAAGRARHDLPHLLDDEADHDRGGADALRGGPLPARRSGRRSSSPRSPGRTVFESGDAESFTTVPLARPITVHDLMVHTSGLTYGFQHEHAVDALYRNRGVEFNANLETPGRARGGRSPPSPWSFSPERAGTTACPPTCSAGWSRSGPASRSMRSSTTASSGHSG